MKKYEVLEHTADLKIKVYGQDLPELFINAALAMAEQQNPEIRKQKPEKEEWESVEIISPDLNSLLVDWLNEILFRSDINNKIYPEIEIKELTDKNLQAEIRGTPVQEKCLEIKAATYYGLEIKKINQHWEVIVIFDI